jgi:HPt (histidine-containing phosphotransfer) domain-containing protein
VSNRPRPEDSVDTRSGERETEAPSFGIVALRELFDGDRAALVDLLEAALASIRRDVTLLAVSETPRERETVIDAAHRIKGTSGTIGARDLIEISSRIAAAAQTTPAPVAPEMLAELQDAARTVGHDVAATIAELSTSKR